MRCVFCKGDLEQTTENYVATLDNCIIIIKDVPAVVCAQCGEVYYSDEVTEKLDTIIDRLSKIVEEVGIFEYSKVA